VGSKVLIGVSAWLLGAVTATGGSLYAVAQLGQGIVEQHSKQVSIAMVNAELAQKTGPHGISPAASRSPAASPKASHTPATSRSGATHRAAPPVTRDASGILTTVGGWADAACSQGEASLLSAVPANNFEVDQQNLNLGPSAVASVTFADSSSGVNVTMKVTCDSSGVPVEHVSESGSWGTQHHDE
jgi:hypothetical protein